MLNCEFIKINILLAFVANINSLTPDLWDYKQKWNYAKKAWTTALPYYQNY